jgi:ABC-2 type transport system permease protein
MRWRKVAVVASTEYGNAVRTKAFLIGMLIMPLLIGASVYIQGKLADQADRAPRAFALIDRTGQLDPRIVERAAAIYNATPEDQGGRGDGPELRPEMAEIEGEGDEALLGLADRVRKGELYAFVVIPEGVLDPSGEKAPPIRYYSDNPNDRTLPRWVERTVNAAVHDRRLRAAGIDPAEAARLAQPVPSESLTLPERAARGGSGIRQARKVDMVRSLWVPFGLMMIIYMVVMATATPLAQAIIEEKMSRISEVLLGSITPTELMLGKLIGGVGVALTIAGMYMVGGYVAATRYGYADSLPPSLIATAVLFVAMAVLLFGSLYLALGSACSELKDAQSLMMPVMLLSMLPLFVWMAVLRQPNGPLAVGMSLFPPATPYLMLLRMAMDPGPPAWQVALSIALTLLTVLACVWAAGKIFRVGLLMQGKAPSFAQLARWVVAK